MQRRGQRMKIDQMCALPGVSYYDTAEEKGQRLIMVDVSLFSKKLDLGDVTWAFCVCVLLKISIPRQTARRHGFCCVIVRIVDWST
jgi:hypothetical protein